MRKSDLLCSDKKTGGQGLEPRITGPEPAVMPFHHPPEGSANIYTVSEPVNGFLSLKLGPGGAADCFVALAMTTSRAAAVASAHHTSWAADAHVCRSVLAHTARSASTIFFRAARTAGKKPPTTPITSAKTSDEIIVERLRWKLNARLENVSQLVDRKSVV